MIDVASLGPRRQEETDPQDGTGLVGTEKELVTHPGYRRSIFNAMLLKSDDGDVEGLGFTNELPLLFPFFRKGADIVSGDEKRL